MKWYVCIGIILQGLEGYKNDDFWYGIQINSKQQTSYWILDPGVLYVLVIYIKGVYLNIYQR